MPDNTSDELRHDRFTVAFTAKLPPPLRTAIAADAAAAAAAAAGDDDDVAISPEGGNSSSPQYFTFSSIQRINRNYNNNKYVRKQVKISKQVSK